ncbi:SIR2 family protein [Luteolibacter ambystomatis]|uniref:SIR2 family protein n=1 Tax=Luteolibacter ambystomatis TaxID=2824561 RepID=A0A975J341_9BACT|nr:SIR2 family protein [Luteolibacter ambystomatis]QUE53144.1 SIR2 family protein [Luteolibacter ambystomatis]
MPDWTGLMRNMLEYCHELNGDTPELQSSKRNLDAGNLTEAANDLRDMLHPAEYFEFRKKQFAWQKYSAAPKEIYERMRLRLQNLEAAPWSGIITTNFDSLIYNVCGNNGWLIHYGDDSSLGHVLSSKERFLVYLHTVAGNKSKVVLSSEDYFKAYLNNSEIKTVIPFLKAAMLSHHFVFIGCSMEPRLLDLRKELYQAFDGEIPVSYALLPNTQQNRDREGYLGTFAIRPVFYDVETVSDPPHMAVDQFLEETAALKV